MRNWSDHARRRRDQRAINDDHIELAIAWGAEVPQHDGRVAYHIGCREVSWARAQGVRIPDRAVGVAVVVAQDGTVVTVVRSPDRGRLRHHGWRSFRRATSQRS